MLAVGFTLALASCGGGSGDNAATTSTLGVDAGGLPDACALLQPTDIASAVGRDYEKGVLNETLSNDNQKVCESTPKDKSGAVVTVMVSLSGNSYEDLRRIANETLPSPVEDLTGVGEAAYWVLDTQSVATRVGSTFMQVSLVSGEKEVVVDLAKSALENM